jgi:arylsulfatase A-like enzyme
MKRDFFPPLMASVFITVTVSIFLSSIFTFFYAGDFNNLSFLHFLGYFSGKVGVYFIILASGSFLFLYLLRKISGKPSFKRGDFGLFLSGFIALTLSIFIVFSINFNVLRYSREFLSYLVNFSIVVTGLFIFVFLYRIFPSSFSLTEKRALKYISGAAAFVFIALSFVSNPLGEKKLTGAKNINNRTDYDREGRYLSSKIEPAPKQLNIIMLSIDTLRKDGLSCYGNPRKTSPNIDILSQDSIIFKNVYSQSSWTLPSHMTLMTSLYPSSHGCMSSPVWTGSMERLDEYWITLAEVLNQAGFRTAAFTDGELLGPTHNFDQGFEVCDDSGGGIKRISQKALTWLEKRENDRPFFLFLHCYDVHNYMPPLNDEHRFVGQYDGNLLKYREKGKALPQRITANAFYNLSEDDVSYIRSLYDAEIFATDREFAKILDYLKSKGLYEEAVIIVTSDHGEEFWEHGGTGHGWSLHQHQLKVPLIWKSPFFPDEKREIQMPIGLIDIYPTLLEGLGIPIPGDAQGISLMPYLKGKDYPSRSLLSEASHLKNQKCLIKDGYSYLYNRFPPIGENLFDSKRFLYGWRAVFQIKKNELFDIDDDPEETNNIIDLKRERAELMKEEMLEKIKTCLMVNNSVMKKLNRLDEQSKKKLHSLGYIK